MWNGYENIFFSFPFLISFSSFLENSFELETLFGYSSNQCCKEVSVNEWNSIEQTFVVKREQKQNNFGVFHLCFLSAVETACHTAIYEEREKGKGREKERKCSTVTNELIKCKKSWK